MGYLEALGAPNEYERMWLIAAALGTTFLSSFLVSSSSDEGDAGGAGDGSDNGAGDTSNFAPAAGPSVDDSVLRSIFSSDIADGEPLHAPSLADILPMEIWEDLDGDGNAFEMGNGLLNGWGNSINDVEGTDDGDIILGGSGFFFADGGLGDDTMVAGPDSAFFSGDDGDDLLYGQGANDELLGGSGDDAIWGAAGDDVLAGGSGANTMDGGAGDDTLSGGGDPSFMAGGSGDDSIMGGGDDILVGGLGDDTLRSITGTAQDTTVMVGTVLEHTEDGLRDRDLGADIMSAQTANSVMIAGSGDFVSAGAGVDQIVVGEWVSQGEVSVINFDAQSDSIVIVFDDSQTAAPEIDVTDHPTEAGFAAITLDGEIAVAIRDEGSRLAVADIVLVALSDTNFDQL